jgi:hypothetical protein
VLISNAPNAQAIQGPRIPNPADLKGTVAW